MNDEHPYAELGRLALESVTAMTEDERTDLLKRAGILDKDGRLAERYRPPGYNAARPPRQSTDAG